MKEGKKIILCPNPSRDRDMSATKAALAILHECGFRTVVCSPFRDQREGTSFADLEVRPLTHELRSADLLITLGGDGTILHLAKLAALNKVPVLGINTGSLGFIAELELGELEMLRRLAVWDFETEGRMMLDVNVLRNGRSVYTNLGLNDAVIREGPISHVIHLRIESDGHHLADIAGDGVIIATPTGSTAYSLSAGGPVVEPEAEAMVVCPICTHNMRFSSYVLSPGHTLSIRTERNGRKPVYLFVDESRGFSLHAEDEVQVRRSKYELKLVRLTEKSFCEIFARKMLPGGQEDEK
ncbi:NAD(+)/NADH kinase [Oscillibacter sp. GMB15532]|uniref:NAD(+)/NADH kinase n=1 Tax=Oscillibacter sp. GMB15532 TaxID=3230022 RepID=UPI0034DE97A9